MAIETNAQQGAPLFLNVRKPASSLNTYDDAQDIADAEAADTLNTVFDRGYAEPRSGSVLAWAKPVGETNGILNSINAITSDRKEYALWIYGPNIYLRDETNNDWIFLNGDYVPPTPSLQYGYSVWNAGVGNDVVYLGNGTDDTLKWRVALDHTTVDSLSGSSSITLSSVAQFPTVGGTLVVKQPNLPAFTAAYTSILGNTLALSVPLTQEVGAGAAISLTIEDMDEMPKGKIFTRFQGRLFISNSKGMETTMFYSTASDPGDSIEGGPEDFTIGDLPTSGGFYGFIQGTGEITGTFDFGQYLGVLKGDSMHRFEFVIDSTNSTKIDQVTPLVSDNGMGCPYFKGWVKKNNVLYYPSLNSGIFSIAPVVTGYQTSVNLQVLSLKIQNLYQSLNFENTKATDFQTKILFTAATANAIDTILVYDTLRQYWTRFNNWAVQDWLNHSNKLYYGSSQDGNIYQVFVANTYTDSNNPYTSYTITKRYDHGNGSMPKTEDLLYAQGYILSSTKLYCDVMFNEQGTQQTVTYVIDGSQPYVVQPISRAMGMVMMGVPILGTSDSSNINQLGIFKVYLPLPVRYGFYNIQFKFYTTASASRWSLTGIGMDPRVEIKAPAQLVIDVTGVVASSASAGSVSIVPPVQQKGLISATQFLVPATSGSDITIDLGDLDYDYVTILFIDRNGQGLTPGTDYSQTGDIVTIFNGYSTDSIMVAYTR